MRFWLFVTLFVTAIATACQIEAEVLDDLNDIDYGAWQWKSYEEIQRAEPQRFTIWFSRPHFMRFPDGESFQELVSRSADALRLVVESHSDDTVVLVAHDSVNRALLLQLLDQPLSIDHGEVTDKGSINQRAVLDHRNRLIEMLYSPTPAADVILP